MLGLDDIIGQGLKLVNGVIDRVIPDPAQAAAAKLAMAKLQQDGQLAELNAVVDIAKGQMAIGLEDAKSTDKFQSRARPFIMWTCGCAFATQYVLGPLVHPFYVIPTLDMSVMMPVLLGILGLGAARTVEKLQGKA